MHVKMKRKCTWKWKENTRENEKKMYVKMKKNARKNKKTMHVKISARENEDNARENHCTRK